MEPKKEPPKSMAESLLGYKPKPPRDNTWVALLLVGMICVTLITITWLITS